MSEITIYDDEEGQFWVRVDQARTREEAEAVLRRDACLAVEGSKAQLLYHGIVTADLGEDDRWKHHRRRRAHLFEDVTPW